MCYGYGYGECCVDTAGVVSYAVYSAAGTLRYAGPAIPPDRAASDLPAGLTETEQAGYVKAMALNTVDGSIYVCPDRVLPAYTGATNQPPDPDPSEWITRYDTDAKELWTLESGAPTRRTFVRVVQDFGNTTANVFCDIPAQQFIDTDDEGNLYVYDGRLTKYTPDGTIAWQRTLSALISNQTLNGPAHKAITRLRCFHGHVYLAGFGLAGPLIEATGGLHAIKFDAETGDFVTVFPQRPKAGGIDFIPPSTDPFNNHPLVGDLAVAPDGSMYISYIRPYGMGELLFDPTVPDITRQFVWGGRGGLLYVNASGDLEWIRQGGSLVLAHDGESGGDVAIDSGLGISVIDSAAALVDQFFTEIFFTSNVFRHEVWGHNYKVNGQPVYQLIPPRHDDGVHRFESSTAGQIVAVHTEDGGRTEAPVGFASIFSFAGGVVADIAANGSLSPKIAKQGRQGGIGVGFAVPIDAALLVSE